MIRARSTRGPSSSTAVLVRLVAFLVAVASTILIPASFVSAAVHHAGISAALATAAVAGALTLATSFAARRLDPLRS